MFAIFSALESFIAPLFMGWVGSDIYSMVRSHKKADVPVSKSDITKTAGTSFKKHVVTAVIALASFFIVKKLFKILNI